MSYFTPPSFWEYDIWLRPVDIAIIGGGVVGMQAALRLMKLNPKLKITIVERSSLGTAASSRNAGFACYGSTSEILADLESMTQDEVVSLIKRRINGLNLLRSTVGDAALRYESTGGYEIFTDGESYDFHLDHLNTINELLREVDNDLVYEDTSVADHFGKVVGMLSNKWEGQIHPGAMTDALRKLCQNQGINILTNFEIQKIERGKRIKLVADKHTLIADKLIVCNNAFAKDLIPIETTAVRNQVLLTSEISDLRLNGCFHHNQGYIYFRNVGNRVLIGGGRDIDKVRETTGEFGETDTIHSYLHGFLVKHVLADHSFSVEHSWSGILGFNETKEPIVQEVESGIFVAVGLGGMGVAIGSLVGYEVADLLLQS